MRSFDLGDELVFAASFSDPVTAQPADPTTVSLELRAPSGAVVPVTTAAVSVGNYRGKYVPGASGIWAIRWLGVGAVMAATEYQFEVRPSAFTGG